MASRLGGAGAHDRSPAADRHRRTHRRAPPGRSRPRWRPRRSGHCRRPAPGPAPSRYVDIEIDLTDRLVIGLGRTGTGDADADGAWPSLIDAEQLEPIDALVRGVDPRFRCTVLADAADRLTVEVVTDDEPTREADEVALTRFSTGAGFGFEDRGAPVTLSRSR